MPDALVVSGAGPYADAWHDFPATSARLAAAVEAAGCRVTLRDDVEPALADPAGVALVVVNVGNPVDPRPQQRLDAVAAGLVRHLDSDGGLLGVHASATSFTGMREWPAILGGRWVRGTTMHPPRDECVVAVRDGDHPVSAGLRDFTVVDERYSYLETQPDATVLHDHAFEDVRHPLVWARDTGGGRVVYDALGHDVASYDAPGHQELLDRSIRWLLRTL